MMFYEIQVDKLYSVEYDKCLMRGSFCFHWPIHNMCKKRRRQCGGVSAADAGFCLWPPREADHPTTLLWLFICTCCDRESPLPKAAFGTLSLNTYLA